MTDKEKKRIIRERVSYWQSALYLQAWELYYKWRKKPSSINPKYIAHCKTDQIYKRATLTFFLPVISQRDMKEIDYYISHELIHVILSDYDWMIDTFAIDYPEAVYTKVKENTTEIITRIIQSKKREAK